MITKQGERWVIPVDITEQELEVVDLGSCLKINLTGSKFNEHYTIPTPDNELGGMAVTYGAIGMSDTIELEVCYGKHVVIEVPVTSKEQEAKWISEFNEIVARRAE